MKNGRFCAGVTECRAPQTLHPNNLLTQGTHWDTSETSPVHVNAKLRIIANKYDCELIFFCHLVAFHPFHEEVWYPQSKEQVSGPLLLFACVLLQLHELKYIGMPRLQVHRKGSRSLSNKQSGVNYFPNIWSNDAFCFFL